LKVGITYHEKFGQYDLGADHPFRGDRFANVMQLFEEQGLLSLPNVIVLKPESVTKQDLLRVHDEDYVNMIFRLAETSRPYDIETPVSPQILEAARLLIGGAIESGKAIYSGNFTRAVALRLLSLQRYSRFS
jgi:acetoin utilization protein AcuC